MAEEYASLDEFGSLFNSVEIEDAHKIIAVTAIDHVYGKRYLRWDDQIEDINSVVGHIYGKAEWQQALRHMRKGESGGKHCVRALYWLYRGRFSSVVEFATKCVSATDEAFYKLWGGNEDVYTRNLTILRITSTPVDAPSPSTIKNEEADSRELRETESELNAAPPNYPQSENHLQEPKWGFRIMGSMPEQDAISSVALTDLGQWVQPGNGVAGFLELSLETVLDSESGLYVGLRQVRVELDVSTNKDRKIEFNPAYKNVGKKFRNAIARRYGVSGKSRIVIEAQEGILVGDYEFYEDYAIKVRPRDMEPANSFEFQVFLSFRRDQSTLGSQDGSSLPDKTKQAVIRTLLMQKLAMEDEMNGWIKMAGQSLIVRPMTDEDRH